MPLCLTFQSLGVICCCFIDLINTNFWFFSLLDHMENPNQGTWHAFKLSEAEGNFANVNCGSRFFLLLLLFYNLKLYINKLSVLNYILFPLLSTDEALRVDFTQFKEMFIAHLEEVVRHVKHLLSLFLFTSRRRSIRSVCEEMNTRQTTARPWASLINRLNKAVCESLLKPNKSFKCLLDLERFQKTQSFLIFACARYVRVAVTSAKLYERYER